MGGKSLINRLSENEAVFRQYNERIQRAMAELRDSAKKDGHDQLFQDKDTPLHFYCECSDENCVARVVVAPSKYNKIHKNRNRFVVAPGHAVNLIERIISKEDGYDVVEKITDTPESPSDLSSTPVNNN